MTDAQRKSLYFPAWHRGFSANWRAERGRVVRLAGDTQWNVEVERVAGMLAEAEVRAVGPEDLRHATNAIAVRRARAYRAGLGDDAVPLDLGRKAVGCGAMDDKYDLSLGLFIAYCDLLEWPECLGRPDRPGGAVAWTTPDGIEREYILGAIERRVVPGYAARVSKDLYGEPDPALLELDRLKDLWRLLGQRKAAWCTREPVAA